jgi:hypothetical protein
MRLLVSSVVVDEPDPYLTADVVTYAWRGAVGDAELVELTTAHGGTGKPGFSFDACGFRQTDAGLIHLPSLDVR